jgi:hypothetical protein
MDVHKDYRSEIADSSNSTPKESRAAKTRRAEALLLDAAYRLTGKLIEVAEGGNAAALMFLLDRIFPKQRPLDVSLPEMTCAGDAVDALGTIPKAIGGGQIAVSEGKVVATVLEAYVRAANLTDARARTTNLERRVRSIEATVLQLLTALGAPKPGATKPSPKSPSPNL